MIRYLLLLFYVPLLFSKSINYGVINKHAYVLPKGKLHVKGAYLKLNDTLDLLNMRQKELGSRSSSLSGIGDLNGWEFALQYGLSTKDTIVVNYQRWNIDYGDSKLKNNKFEIFNRYNIVASDYAFFNAFSIDVGYIQNKTTPIDIKRDSLLNSILNKIKPNSGISLHDGDIVAGDTTISLYNDNGNKIHPYASIENLSSKSYYVRVLLAKNISKNSFMDFYLSYIKNSIKTKIALYPQNNSFFNSIAQKYKIPNMNRDEHIVNAGFVYMGQYKQNYLFEFNYEYNRIFRSKSLSANNTSNTIEAYISRRIGKSFLVYVGGKLMMQQFNTDLPYLYNKYTQTQFDKKYGFAKFGFIYSY